MTPEKIRSAAEKEIKEPVVIGEVWENASNKMSYGQRKMYFTNTFTGGILCLR